MPPSEATLDGLFDECAQLTADAYCAQGHTFGLRWLTGPRASLSSACELAFITLNPGGGQESAHQSGASYEGGSSYVTESWLGQPAGKAPLQRQVQALFRELMPHLGESGSVDDYLNRRVLSGHFIPFRSPSLAALGNRSASIDFGRQLWGRVLAEWRPRLILTIDREAFSNLGDIVGTVGGRRVEQRSFPTGWGQYSCEAVRYSGFGERGLTTLARLPHLSRFTLFSEPGYSERRRAPLAEFFAWVTAPP